MRTHSLATMAAAAVLLLVGSAEAQLPKLVFSIAGSGVSICDTNPPNDCFFVDDEDLFTCKPTSASLPITGCDWEPFFDGGANGLTAQTFATDVLPNGAIVFRSGADRTLPDLSQIKARDLGVFFPDNVLQPYQGGGAYTSGTFKLYLDGDATQETTGAAPYDAVAVVTNGTCEQTVTPAGVHSCPLVGSLSGSHTFDGRNFLNEDLLRCTPTSNASGGSITSCQYDMFWEGSHINNGALGFTGNFFAAELLSFDPMTFSGELIFRGPSDPELPTTDPTRDLILYTGTFGNGVCTGVGGELCAGDGDCPIPQTCNTGSCAIGGAPCASDGDCSGVGNSCSRTRTPVGAYTLFFDGSAAGLSGQSIMAFGVIPDGDGDDVPDGIDNCPNDPNPVEICANAMTACTTNDDCGVGDSCVQLDTDGDGVGDVCDQCEGRDDAVCFCGDGIRDLPSEKCDLGANNGQPDIPCSATCQIIGKCTTAGTLCEDASDCPPGEGCCGNDIIESPEQCDDGNGINGDACDNTCAINPDGIPVLGCEDVFGPHLVPAFVRRTKLTDTNAVAGTDFDRWRSRGDFNLATGADIDPDTELVRLILNQGTSPAIFDVAPPIGSFIENPNRPSWQFLDPEADVPGAIGWKKGKLNLAGNKVRFSLNGKNFPIPVDTTPPIRIRQTLRIGNECATGIIECTPNNAGNALKCSTVLLGE